MSPAYFGRYVAYYRVSTDKQGKSGLGLAAQKTAVEQRLNGGPWTLVDSFTEIESGRRKSRPELAKALAACEKQKAKLVVAKLDRLTRNVRFLLTLIDSGVDILFADLPQITADATGRFVLIMLANIAELEAGLVSERTKKALAEAKKDGVEIGRHGAELAAKNRAAAAERAKALAPIFEELVDLNLRDAAGELRRRKIPTASGGKWHAASVARVRERLGM
jgi:DNA invertase Pin-like site-specific DNA recombinase